MLAELGRAVLLEHGVLGNGEGQHQAALLAVFVDGRDLVVDDVARRGVLDLLAVHEDLSGGGFGQAGDGLDELLLAVAIDACDADDFAGADREVEAFDGLDAALVVHVQVANLKDGLAGRGGLLLDLEVHVVSDHHVGEVLLRDVRDGDFVDVLAAADDRAGVGGRLDLLELVGDDDDGLTRAGEVVHDLDEAVDLLGRENRGGLVQDQDVGAAVERLQDLDALLHTDRDVLDLGIGVDLEAVLLDDLADLLTCLFHVEDARCTAHFAAEHDVLGHGEIVHEHEVLVDHADAMGDGVVGGVDDDGLAVEADLALVGLV